MVIGEGSGGWGWEGRLRLLRFEPVLVATAWASKSDATASPRDRISEFTDLMMVLFYFYCQ
jgi:hypothetical protein